jgi:hypothetical protein
MNNWEIAIRKKYEDAGHDLTDPVIVKRLRNEARNAGAARTVEFLDSLLAPVLPESEPEVEALLDV